MLTVHHLASLACTVEAFEDGKKAPDAVKAARLAGSSFDLVLMDCQMPIMDGYAAAAEIRKLEAAEAAVSQPMRRVHIVALTANAMEGERQRCITAGMDDYLAKPFSPEQLRALVSAALRDRFVTEQDQHIGSREMSELGGPMLRRLLEVFSVEAPSTLSDMEAAISWDDCPLLA